MILDLKLALRRLLATPLFTAFAILSLAAGVGVTTAVYSVVGMIFLKNAGIHRPDEVAFVVWPRETRLTNALLSLPDFQDLRAAQQSFSSLSATAMLRTVVASESMSQMEMAEAVDGAYFSTLGVRAAIGRTIQPGDDAGAARVAVLSEKLWRERFAADPSIVGRSIRIAGQLFEVVGVAQAKFEGPAAFLFGTAIWIPLSAEPPQTVPLAGPRTGPPAAARDRRRLTVFGRLAPSASLERATADVTAIGVRLDEIFPPPQYLQRLKLSDRSWRARLATAPSLEDTTMRRVGIALTVFVGLVLVVACTNLANLVLARGTTRRYELGVREALGAPRWRLVREQVAESALLAIGGAVAAAMVFLALQRLMSTDFTFPLPDGSRWTLAVRPELDRTAALLAAASLLGSLIVFGLEPALALTRASGTRRSLSEAGGSPARTARHELLLRLQVAASAGFFIIATMFVRYSVAQAWHDPGVVMDGLAVAVLNLEDPSVDREKVRQSMERLLAGARRDQALSLSVSRGLPFGVQGAMKVTLAAEDGSDRREATAIAATPDVFRVLGVPILRGRGLNDRDRGGAPVVVLSELAARRVFGTSDVVGRRVRLRGSVDQDATVVGVAHDTDVGYVWAAPAPVAYIPLLDAAVPGLTVAARSATSAESVNALRRALRNADRDLPVGMIGTGLTMLAGPYVFLTAMGATALALGGLTLLLAMAGLFGIQSHFVSLRTKEIGVRMSFGASAGQIHRMVLLNGLRPVVGGLSLGLLIGIAGRLVVRYYMEIDVAVIDPWMLAVVPVPLVLAGFSACYLPAKRAASVDPCVALRAL